jgi:hypothetical protein
MEGFALSEELVREFLDRLEESSIFGNVELVALD